MTDQTVQIDGQSYSLDSLSDEAKAQLGNLQFADQEIARLNALLAITTTARNAYAQALQKALTPAQ